MPSRSPRLSQLRRRVDAADRDLARAIRRRLRLAAAIGRTKSRAGFPLRDHATERRVVSRWTKRLGRSGVSAGRSEALGRWLIEESLRVQEASRGRPGPPPGVGLRVAIVGGAGGMGRWLDGFLTDAGYDVRILDPKAPRGSPRTLPSLRAAMTESDVVAFVQ